MKLHNALQLAGVAGVLVLVAAFTLLSVVAGVFALGVALVSAGVLGYRIEPVEKGR